MVQVSERGRRLNLLSVEKRHNGSWSCVARNLAGETSKSFQLTVQSTENTITVNPFSLFSPTNHQRGGQFSSNSIHCARSGTQSELHH